MALEFWRDTNGPGASKKSDLPIASISNPACMAVRDDGSVFVGGAEAGGGGELVVKATSADDYATWTDLTDSHPVAAITALESL